jgi:hypothetical protein
MGNICSWCFKTQNESENLNGDHSGINNSQRSLSSSEATDRTPYVIAIIN